jgi:hypothetical protein
VRANGLLDFVLKIHICFISFLASYMWELPPVIPIILQVKQKILRTFLIRCILNSTHSGSSGLMPFHGLVYVQHGIQSQRERNVLTLLLGIC